MKKRNPVAKNAGKFNRSSVQEDRKKASKRGYQKYKSPHGENHEGFFFVYIFHCF
jgi:hypothetical protein